MDAIEAFLSPARLAHYTKGDRQLSLRTYIWNARLCEEFMIPVQLAEIGIRNQLNQALIGQFGLQWRFRNRIAHHESVFNFDGGPTSQYRNIQDIMSWICPDTLWLLRQVSNPAAIVSQ
eukprot:gene7321-7393_t